MVTSFHMVVTKPYLIKLIKQHGASSVLKDWEGTEQEAIDLIYDDKRDYFPFSECDNQAPDGKCLGHKGGA